MKKDSPNSPILCRKFLAWNDICSFKGIALNLMHFVVVPSFSWSFQVTAPQAKTF